MKFSEIEDRGNEQNFDMKATIIMVELVDLIHAATAIFRSKVSSVATKIPI